MVKLPGVDSTWTVRSFDIHSSSLCTGDTSWSTAFDFSWCLADTNHTYTVDATFIYSGKCDLFATASSLSLISVLCLYLFMCLSVNTTFPRRRCPISIKHGVFLDTLINNLARKFLRSDQKRRRRICLVPPNQTRHVTRTLARWCHQLYMETYYRVTCSNFVNYRLVMVIMLSFNYFSTSRYCFGCLCL